MQKIINVLALTSFTVSALVVGGGIYLFTQKDALIEAAKEKAMQEVTNLLPGLIAGSLPGLGGGLPDVGNVDRTLEGMDSSTGAGPFPIDTGFSF